MKRVTRSLEQVLSSSGMQILKLTLETKDGSAERCIRPFRVVVPSAPDWPQPLLRQGRGRISNPAALLLALRLFESGELATLQKRRNMRRFELVKLPRDRSFRELARAVGQDPVPENVIPKLIGESSRTVEQELAEARYAAPLRSIPIDAESYADFRSMLLDEIDEARAKVEQAVAKHKLSPELARRVRREVSGSFVRHVLRLSLASETHNARVFAGLADRAASILAAAQQRYQGNSRAPIRSRFDWLEVDRLLFDSRVARGSTVVSL